MVLVAVAGAADQVEVFDWSLPLAALVHDIPETRFVRTYAEVLEEVIDDDLARAVRSLLHRTDPAPPTPSRWRRRMTSASPLRQPLTDPGSGRQEHDAGDHRHQDEGDDDDAHPPAPPRPGRPNPEARGRLARSACSRVTKLAVVPRFRRSAVAAAGSRAAALTASPTSLPVCAVPGDSARRW